MAQDVKMPSYMAQLLEELGWNQGTRIPLANPENQGLESLLINRQNEIQTLKEALSLQNQKRVDLNKYKEHVDTEYQENTRLLFAHKQQMEQQVKFKQLNVNEADRLDRDVIDSSKQSKDITARIDRLQTSIGRLLKKADMLKADVCGERGALQEWRAALERSADDITAIEQFTKQDLSKAKALETKRQKLKSDHDRAHERLLQLVADLNAEERACNRISVQVMEGMEQRKEMMSMWTGAIENLRQRDTDIRHIREDYAVLEQQASVLSEQCREQQLFCEQQRGNNDDAVRDNAALAQTLSNARMTYAQILDYNLTNDSEAKSLQRELSNMRNTLEKMHMENKHIMEEQHRKDVAIKALCNKIKELKEKVNESLDKSKSSEKRAKELEDMLNDEERYASNLTVNQQRAMHCSFVEQQKLLALKNDEKLFHMQLKSSKAIISKLETKYKNVEKTLQSQKEALYAIMYQVETIGAAVSQMEGAQAERLQSAELMEREHRLKEVHQRHAARCALLDSHCARLKDDMRRLARATEGAAEQHGKLQSRLKSSTLSVQGGAGALKSSRDAWRRLRVEEALMKLRVAHAARAVAGLGDTAYSIDKQRLQLEAAMNERLVEISARRDMFSVQKRALLEDCGRLRSDIKERDNRIEQLKKRYDIFIASLGKDDSGEQLSVTFFKIKFAAERAELRERGALLDVDIGRCERDVAALEATLRLMHAAHQHFLRRLAPLDQHSPEMEELSGLSQQYYELRDGLKSAQARAKDLDAKVSDLAETHTLLNDKYKQLTAREYEAENELESCRERVAKQQSRLDNARDSVRHYMRRAKKLLDDGDHWRVFQMSLWVRDYSESSSTALRALSEACGGGGGRRLGALLAAADLGQHLGKQHRRLQTYIERIITESEPPVETTLDVPESVFSSSRTSSTSSESAASGFSQRLRGFRRGLAPAIQEPKILESNQDYGRRSAMSLRVVTLGLGDTSASDMQN